MKVAHVLYPGFTALDVVGTFQVLAAAPGVETLFVAEHRGAVRDDTRCCSLRASLAFDEVSTADVVVVPGSTSGCDLDGSVVEWLRIIHPTTAWTTSVGAGSILLAAAGLLDGCGAATHWASADRLERFGVPFLDQRVVKQGKIITAAGSTAGIDMALTLVTLSHGPAVAQAVQLAIQYDPEPPYDAGTPAKAPAQIGDLVSAYYASKT